MIRRSVPLGQLTRTLTPKALLVLAPLTLLGLAAPMGFVRQIPAATREDGRPLDVRAYGAVGDGTTDDTDAIQTALDSQLAKGKVLFPGGTFKITRPLVIRGRTSGLVVEGSGKGVTTLLNAGQGDGIQSLGPNSYNVVIRDLTIRGTGEAQAAVHFDLTYHGSVVNVEARNGRHGIRIERSFYTTVQDCWCHHNLLDGIVLGRTANANLIVGGAFGENGRNGIRIDSEGAAGGDIASGNTIMAATVEANGAENLCIVDSDHNRLISGYFENPAGTRRAHVLIAGSGPSISSDFNLVEATHLINSTPSIRVAAGRGTTVIGNSIYNGIDLTDRAIDTRVGLQAHLAGEVSDGGWNSSVEHSSDRPGRYYRKAGVRPFMSLDSGKPEMALGVSSGAPTGPRAYMHGTSPGGPGYAAGFDLTPYRYVYWSADAVGARGAAFDIFTKPDNPSKPVKRMTIHADGAVEFLGSLRLQQTNGPVGTFLMGEASSFLVRNSAVTSSSLVYLFPTNADAAALMGSAGGVFIAAREPGVGFTVKTADGRSASGRESFNYLIVN